VTIQRVNAPAIALDGIGAVVVDNVTLDTIDATGFGPVAVFGRGPSIADLTVTNVTTDDDDAVVVNFNILHATTGINIFVNGCAAATNCVHWAAEGSVSFATF